MIVDAGPMDDEIEALPGSEEFDARRWAKWVKGRAERGRPLDAPFDGDPAAEGREECEDQANYADELLAQGDISEAERAWAYPLILQLDQWFGLVRERRAARLSVEFAQRVPQRSDERLGS